MTSSAAGSRAAVQGVTTAAPARSEDRTRRMRVYVVQMMIRTACFIAALFTHGWWQLVFIIGAVVLPYVAVVSVNNSGPQTGGTLRPVDPAAPALPPRPSAPRADEEPVVLVGDVVEHPAAPRALEPGRRPGRGGQS